MTMLVRNWIPSPEDPPFDDAPRRAARLLHPAAGCAVEPLDTDALTDIAVGLAQTAEPVEPAPGDVLTRRRLLRTERYDVWLVRWSGGAVADVHDHDGSVGVVHVIEGSLIERSTGLDGSARPDEVILAGATAAFGVDSVHSLSNRSVDRPALAVQVFSPPLGER